MQNPGYASDTDYFTEEDEEVFEEESNYSDEDDIEDTESIEDSVISSTVKAEAVPEPPPKTWDLLKTTPDKRDQESVNEFWKKINICIKIFLCIIFFLFLLSTCILTKITFLIIVYNINITSHDVILPNRTTFTIKPGNGVTEVQWIWALVIIICAPYFFTLWKCLHVLIFKGTHRLKWKYFLLAIIIETIHSVGLGIFVYIAAPSGDSIYTLYLFQGISLVPSVLKCLPSYIGGKLTSGRQILVYIFSALLHLGFLIIVGLKSGSLSSGVPWLFPIATACVSIYWWENFVPRSEKEKGFLETFAMKVRHTKIELGVTLWKIILNLFIPLVIFAPMGCADTLYFTDSQSSNCSLLGNVTLINEPARFTTSYLPFILAGVNIASSIIGFKVATTACVIHSQIACFALPLALATPVSFLVILLSYKYQFLHDILGYQVAWPMLNTNASWIDFLDAYTTMFWLPVLFVEFANILVTVHYIWKPGSSRLTSSDSLFVKSMYCGVFFDQSLLMNRSSNDDIVQKRLEHKSHTDHLGNLTTGSTINRNNSHKHHSTVPPLVYACATMWRESEKEMTQLMKSIFRVDLDQFEKSYRRFNYEDTSPDYYKFEAHIFFDDAFTDYKNKTEPIECRINDHVQRFLKVLPVASSAVYMGSVRLYDPIKYVTPYGGRLVWVMPGDNKLIVHLKDKYKIKIKKRWSQVMYMYYLLSYLIIANKAVGKKDSVARNTFILALDGDIDFYPDAVQLLLDRMRKNKKLGAASGRIHPKGSGPMVWYQKFEYSVSHWLQKTTEHKLGCVLCSPGCFSLFRGSALLQHNVINKYASVCSDARHFIQYDMGEDRWLCTLLLKAGRRIEYCAAADASTYCPEGFNEFYKQRRRWTPSTMANIIDLLSSWNTIRKHNTDVSILYIIYQVFLFVSSILTPGTIFLMILGAFNTAYPTVPLYGAMVINILPVVVFVILCFSTNENVQLGYAAIMSTVYSLVMMIVIVGLLKQIVDSHFCSVTAVFFLSVVGIFITSALFHPREILNIFHGVIYFLTIPSSSMLLIIYALSNLDNGKWGTRDNVPKTSTDPVKDASVDPKKSGRLNAAMMNSGALFETIRTKFSSDYNFSFGNLFRCICCPSSAVKEEDVKMKAILEKLEGLEDQIDNLKYEMRGRKPIDEDEWNKLPYTVSDSENKPFSSLNLSFEGGTSVNPIFRRWEIPEEDDTKWITNPSLEGITDMLSNDETIFWKEFIAKYMTPKEMSEEQKEQAASDLKQLRNKVCLFFFLLNALFITIIFILETVSRYSPGLTVQLPCDKGHEGQKIEPISIAFTLIFGILLVLQFICMLFHRVSTLIHIASSTDVSLKKTRAEKERARAQVLDKYNRMFRRGGDYGSVRTIDSIPSDDGGTGVDMVIRRDRFFLNRLMKQSKQEKSTPHRLFDVYQENQKSFVNKLEQIDVRQSSDELRNTVRKKFRNMPAASIKAIIDMAKDEEFKEKMKQNARKRWGIARAAMVPKPEPGISKIVSLMMEQRKSKAGNLEPYEENENSKSSTVQNATRSVQFESDTLEGKEKTSKMLWSKVASSVVKEDEDSSSGETLPAENTEDEVVPKKSAEPDTGGGKSGGKASGLWSKVADSFVKDEKTPADATNEYQQETSTRSESSIENITTTVL